MRSTGTGWAFGVGRVGSILGPVIGGQLLAFGLPLGMLFAAASMPILISAGALFLLGRLPIVRNRTAEAAAASTAMPSPLYPITRGHRP
jgi:AAHS family 4-hydroxybenzoate transporter-like MFS transporter